MLQPYCALLLTLAACNSYQDTIDPGVMAANIAEAEIGTAPELTPELKVGLEDWFRPRFEYYPDEVTFRWVTRDVPRRDYFQPGSQRMASFTVNKNTGKVEAYPLMYAWRAIVLVHARDDYGAMKDRAWSFYLLDDHLIGLGSPIGLGIGAPSNAYTGLERMKRLGTPIPIEELEGAGVQALDLRR